MSLSRSTWNTRSSCAIRTSGDGVARRKRSVDDSYGTMKSASDEIADAQPFKRANFSDVSSGTNGLNRHSPLLVTNKPPSVKKIVIKNLTGNVL